MPFVEAKCTNCGAVLPVDSARDAWVCGYCGTPFVVEKAIQQFNITNNITAGTVVVQGGKEDFEIRGGVLMRYNGSATEVVVPDNVVEIRASAFGDCAGITSVMLPRGLERIGEYAFLRCSRLKTVHFPASLKIIGDFAFSGCHNLSEVLISKECYKHIQGDTVFADTPFLKIRKQQVEQKRKEQEQRERQQHYRQYGWCQHCGGKFSKRTQACKRCGKPKDY